MEPQGAPAHRLATSAWLHGTGLAALGLPEPGLLTAEGDWVRFITRKGEVFAAQRAEIAVKWPAMGMGAAIYLAIGGRTYKLSLVRPKGATTFDATAGQNMRKAAAESLVPLASIAIATGDLKSGRASGRAWKAYFEGVPPASAPTQPNAAQPS